MLRRTSSIFKTVTSKARREFGLSYAHGVSDIPLIYKTVGRQLRETTEKFPDNVMIVSRHQNTSFTYSEFLKKAEQIAASLVQLGFSKGDRIGIYSQNNYEWLLTQLATSLADIILVNINPSYRVNELKYALNKVGCRGLILSNKFRKSDYIQIMRGLAPEIDQQDGRSLNSKELPDLKVLVHLGKEKVPGFLNFDDLYHLHDASHVSKLHQIENNISPEDPINIQFTSGTTGTPKGAILSHHNIINNGYFVGGRCGFTEKDSVCVTVPLYHCFGMVMANLAMICRGGKLVYPDEMFNPVAALESVGAEKITGLYGVPTMFIEMLRVNEENKGKFDLSTLRTGIIAGSLAPPVVLERIISEFGLREITNAYGMTETSPVSFQTTSTDSMEDRITSVGRPLPHIEGKVMNPLGRVVEQGVPGELWVRGATVMLGYWGDDIETQKSMHKGWMKTGDIAVLDERGYCKIVGRLKDMIIRGGENIYPKEIEDFIMRHPNVEDVQVVAVADEKFGEEIAALIKPKDSTIPLDKTEILQYCKGNISHYKIPKYVKFVDRFPMTVTGKPQKFIMTDELNKELKDPIAYEQYKIRDY